MGNGIRHWTERILLALMATAGLAVALTDLFGLLDKLSLSTTIPKITLLVLSTVTLFLLLEIDRLKQLDGVSALLSKLDINAIARDLKHQHYGGAMQVHPRFPEDLFNACVKSAEREVTILQTWIPNLQGLEAALEDAIQREVLVRVLLLNPTSLAVGLRTEALRPLQNPSRAPDARAGVEECLSIFESIYTNSAAARKWLRVRVYNSLPAVAVYRSDHHYFVSSFWHGVLAINSPQIEIDGTDTSMGQAVQRELDTLWEIGHDVDLRDWRRSIDIM
ncbi:MAG TPA: hypothetical protein VF069_28255 [Streptosporangiaceae bacterium]